MLLASSHQFETNNGPYGVTMTYLSADSHLSIHTFVDEGKITLYLITCDINLEDRYLKKKIVNTLVSVFLNIDAYYFTTGNETNYIIII